MKIVIIYTLSKNVFIFKLRTQITPTPSVINQKTAVLTYFATVA